MGGGRGMGMVLEPDKTIANSVGSLPICSSTSLTFGIAKQTKLATDENTKISMQYVKNRRRFCFQEKPL